MTTPINYKSFERKINRHNNASRKLKNHATGTGVVQVEPLFNFPPVHTSKKQGSPLTREFSASWYLVFQNKRDLKCC